MAVSVNVSESGYSEALAKDSAGQMGRVFNRTVELPALRGLAIWAEIAGLQRQRRATEL